MRGDTVTTELVVLSGDDTTRVIAHDAMYTLDGKVGSPLGWSITFTTGAGVGLFGAGTGDCITRIDLSGTPVVSGRSCGIADTRYSFEATPEYRAKARAIAAARPFAAGALAVPGFLPAYVGSLATSRGNFILRPFSNDSLAFRQIGSDTDVMIAGIEGFVGCRAIGCLWMSDSGVPQMMFAPAAVFAGAVPGSGARRETP
jgi:hypothetical protein